ncbi:CobQ/CobB/MinD/ParA nucleotide binding domain-containing protein [Streptomyces sp. 1222.5]|nr:CobQ/CobB/MinD/ParA family nucleotide binding protein [Streptomyces sp. 5112.2]SEB58787.1 CobQ/CobB/MinD/ParA nucleotide binding domain-containing protein [Streptomyces sp. 1222.5]
MLVLKKAASSPFRGQGVTVLGMSAGVGKTAVSIGILRSLSRRGVDCAPFKAVAVVTPDEYAGRSLPPWRRGVVQSCTAAGTVPRWWHNPVLVNLPDARTPVGDLYVRGRRLGRVPVTGADRLDLGSLPDRLRRRCQDAVEEGYRRLAGEVPWLLVEGAAGAGDLPPAADLANRILPELAGLPVIVVASARQADPADVSRLTDRLTPALRALLLGFVLNRVSDHPAADAAAQRLARASRLPVLARITDAPPPLGYDGSPEKIDLMCEYRASCVDESGLMRLLDALPAARPGLVEATR